MNLIINSEYDRLSDWIKEVPVFFSTKGELIYKDRNELKRFDAEFGKMVVKSFKVPHIINRFAYSFLRSSKAERSYTYSFEILRRGIKTPQPVAYIELFKTGLLSESYFISDFTDFTSMKSFNYTKKITEEDVEILIAFAQFTALLHEKEIYHADYSNGNILYKKEDENICFELIDLNRIKFKQVTKKMSYKAFHRLDLSVEMLEIVAREYAMRRQMDVEKSINEIRRLNLNTMKRYR